MRQELLALKCAARGGQPPSPADYNPRRPGSILDTASSIEYRCPSLLRRSAGAEDASRAFEDRLAAVVRGCVDRVRRLLGDARWTVRDLPGYRSYPNGYIDWEGEHPPPRPAGCRLKMLSPNLWG